MRQVLLGPYNYFSPHCPNEIPPCSIPLDQCGRLRFICTRINIHHQGKTLALPPTPSFLLSNRAPPPSLAPSSPSPPEAIVVPAPGHRGLAGTRSGRGRPMSSRRGPRFMAASPRGPRSPPLSGSLDLAGGTGARWGRLGGRGGCVHGGQGGRAAGPRG